MKIGYEDGCNFQKFSGLRFGGKIPKKTVSKLTEDSLKIAAAAALAAGTAGIAINQNAGLDTLNSVRDFAKENLKQKISRETYIVVKNNFMHSEEALNKYLVYETKKYVKDYDKLDNEKSNYIKDLMKEIILERIYDTSLAEDFSDIKFIPPKEKVFTFKDIFLSKEILETLAEQGLSVAKIAKLLNCGGSTVFRKISEFGIQTERKQHNDRLASPEFEKQVLELYKKGLKSYEIAEEVKCSNVNVLEILKRNELQTEYQKKLVKLASPEFADSVVEVYGQTLNVLETARILECDDDTVRRILNERNVELKYDRFSKPEFISKVLDLHAKGFGINKIAEIMECSETVIRRIFDENELKSAKQMQDGRLASPEVVEEIIKLCDEGLNLKEIAARVNASEAAVKHILEYNGKKTLSQIRLMELNSPEYIGKIKALYAEGHSIIGIARIMGCSDFYVKTVLVAENSYEKKYETKPPEFMTPEFIAKVGLLHKRGLNMTEISKELNCSKEIVRKIFLSEGWETEKQKQNKRVAQKEFQDEVIRLHLLGYNMLEIAGKVQCNSCTVGKILKANGFMTDRQKNMAKIEKELREKILTKIVEGCCYNDICADLNISLIRLHRILLKYNIKIEQPKVQLAEKNYEEFTQEEIKDKLIALHFENSVISDNDEISDLIEFLYEKPELSNEERLKAVDFIKLLDEVVKNKIFPEEAFKSEQVKYIYDWMISEDELQLAEAAKLEKLKSSYDSMLSELIKEQNKNIYEICLKYAPANDNISDSEFILKTFAENDLLSAERKIIYWDLKHSPNNLLKFSENYSKEKDGSINEEKAGQFIMNSNVLNKFLQTGETSGYPECFMEIIKHSNLPENLLVRYLIKIENWKNDAEKTSMNDFLSVFKLQDGDIENEFIKTYIEKFYLNMDTEISLQFENGQKHTAVFSKEAKNSIYKRHKYPNCLDYFCKFEEAMNKPAGKKGETGIKNCKSYYEVKIKGYPDRLFSSSNNLRFDTYSYQHE